MPKLSQHQSAKITKLLLIGNQGTGKTGALTALAVAGYHLHILDMDNGLDVLFNLIKQAGPEFLANVDYFTVTDKFKNVAGKATPINADAWARAIKYLDNWTNKDETYKDVDAEGKPVNVKYTSEHPDFLDCGKPQDWGPDHVLVIDSFSFLCRAAMRYILRLNSRPTGPVYESDWGEAQALVENFLSMIYDTSFNTNVVVTAHIDVRTDKNGVTTANPVALGKALGPKVGSFFNSMLEVRRSGAGTSIKRSLHSVPAGLLELKNPNPAKVKASYDIKDGLAEYFKAVREG